MKNQSFIFSFILLMLVQFALGRYGQFPYLYISLLPAMIMCLPMALPTWLCCIIAFLCGLGADFICDGVLGLNAVALVPIAAVNKTFVGFFISEELVERHYAFSFRQNGLGKVGGLMFLEICIYMLIYNITDNMGDTGNLVFISIKTVCSILASSLLGLVVVNTLCPKQTR